VAGVADTPVTATIPYAEARHILEALRAKLSPALKAKTPRDLTLDWASRRREEIRARLERGDEDSIVNLWYYGTSFTALPPLSLRSLTAVAADGRSAERITQGRLDDLITGIASPGTNERLQFARAVIERKSLDPTTSQGTDAVRGYLLEIRRRILAEREERSRSLESARLLSDQSVARLRSFTQFDGRGLSSDTSILSSFTIERALELFKAGDLPRPGQIRRAAIVGPGLDFTDKNDGYDFYPLQTIQPFAVIDSLIRLGLSTPEDLRLTTFDVSSRVIRHIDRAGERARAGDSYTLQIPLDQDVPWKPALVAYWRGFGDSIGEAVKAMTAPPYTGNVLVRAVRVRPHIVRSIAAQNLNIVLERLARLPVDRQFDLVIATNVLVYYDVFEQTLALANIASMLRPGGVFVSNTPVFSTSALKPIGDYFEVPHTDTQSDYLFFYERQ
jgi:hypothetical protein